MKLYETKFRERKCPLKTYQDIKFEEPSTWVVTDYVTRPLEDELWFVMRMYCEDAEPTPYSPFDAIIVTESELKEYFEEIA